jgi:hypothetical protein
VLRRTPPLWFTQTERRFPGRPARIGQFLADFVWPALAKTSSGPEINNLHNFLKPTICYDCTLCSGFFASGWERSSGFFDPGKACWWRTSHFVSSSVYSSVETGGPNWSPSISSSGSWPGGSGPIGKSHCLWLVAPETVVRWHGAGFRPYWHDLQDQKAGWQKQDLPRSA